MNCHSLFNIKITKFRSIYRIEYKISVFKNIRSNFNKGLSTMMIYMDKLDKNHANYLISFFFIIKKVVLLTNFNQ